jgi:hypothetical protein
VEGASPKTRPRPDRLSRILMVGPILLFLTATTYGILEVHSSTDTWIGLAAGRQILTSDEFPKTDTFSYTFYGKVWYNQNWLTHLVQYWLYSRIAPNAVVYGTWTLSASVFFLTLLAAYWRTRNWLGALVAASVVGLGCRDFLSARPATTGFVCIASLWALICAIEGQREQRRWWPVALLLPLLLIWGNAHGSFVFGYGVLGLYIGYWFLARTISVKHSWTFSLLLVLIVMLIGGVMYSAVPPDANVEPQEVLKLGGTTLYKSKLLLLSVVVIAYAASWAWVRYRRPRPAVSDRQVAGIVGVVAAALILTVALGPFGLENFTHGQKVAGSKVFRQVSEWNPPTAPGKHFPPVWRFWTILGVSLGMLVGCGLLCLIARTTTHVGNRKAPRKARNERAPPGEAGVESPGQPPYTSLFDVAMVAIGLSMTLWARRFGPIYFIFGAPAFLTWIVLLLRPLWGSWRRHLRLAVMAGAGLFSIGVAYEAGRKAHSELVARFDDLQQFNLLERVTGYNRTPHGAILFLSKNELNVNLLVEWTQAGPVMFYAPNAKVFMDGRAQQVYDERHYSTYYWLMVAPDTPRHIVMRILDQHDTDAVLLRRVGRVQNIWTALKQSREWVSVLTGLRYELFFRKGSRGLQQLGELLRRGEEWRPDSPAALASRGLVWQASTPRDLEQAIACWQGALRQSVLTGSICFLPMTEALLELGREQEAREFVQSYYGRLNEPVAGLPDQARHDLLKKLSTCWDAIARAGPTNRAED